jgi:SOS-response transcriptional repressor LexA
VRLRRPVNNLIFYTEFHGYQPSSREMAAEFNVTRRAIHDRLKQLESKGFIALPSGERERAIDIRCVTFKAIFNPNKFP